MPLHGFADRRIACFIVGRYRFRQEIAFCFKNLSRRERRAKPYPYHRQSQNRQFSACNSLAETDIATAERRKNRSKCEYILADGDKPVFVRSYQRTFELLLKKLHIPHKGFHSLRHTFATRAIECGVDIKTLAELLGHKNATITLNRYAHSLLEHKVDMMNRLGKLL